MSHGYIKPNPFNAFCKKCGLPATTINRICEGASGDYFWGGDTIERVAEQTDIRYEVMCENCGTTTEIIRIVEEDS